MARWLHFAGSPSLIISFGVMFCAAFRACSFTAVRRSFPLIRSTVETRRTFGSTVGRFRSQTECMMTIADTPLGNPEGSALLDGLDVFSVPASGDQHPLTLYGINSENPETFSDSHLRPILLLHGRTWSSIPVYHLLGGPNQKEIGEHESRSLMESLLSSGLQPYAMDFRGFGGTPPDSTGGVEPNRCVADVETALKWIAKRHSLDGSHANNTYALLHPEMPALLGWSQGALVAQMVAQKSPELLSKLTLYGSIYDPLVRYDKAPLYASEGSRRTIDPIINTIDGAIEDFTVEGSIPPEPALLFGEAALVADPVKAQWTHLHQFNNLDPARVHVPTLVIAGDQDPYAPMRVQSELFSNLGRGSDRTWSIMSDCDHAVHLLDGRARFAKTVTNFVQNGVRSQS